MRNFVAGLVVAGLVLIAVAPVAAQQQDAQKHPKKNTVQQATESYTCPMHPEVTATKEGKCTKCGMALEKKVQKPVKMKKEGMKHGEKGKCEGCDDTCGGK